MRRSYDFKFKLQVIREAEKTNNCAAARKFDVTENNVRRWRQQKNDLSKSSGTRTAFRGPKRGRFDEIEVEVVKYINDIRREGFPVTRESVQFKGREVARNLSINQFKASVGWCTRMMRRNGCVVFIKFSEFNLLSTRMGRGQSTYTVRSETRCALRLRVQACIDARGHHFQYLL
jgi:transposase-like protein